MPSMDEIGRDSRRPSHFLALVALGLILLISSWRCVNTSPSSPIEYVDEEEYDNESENEEQEDRHDGGLAADSDLVAVSDQSDESEPDGSSDDVEEDDERDDESEYGYGIANDESDMVGYDDDDSSDDDEDSYAWLDKNCMTSLPPNSMYRVSRSLLRYGCAPSPDEPGPHPGAPEALTVNVRYSNSSGECVPMLDVTWKVPVSGARFVHGFTLTLLPVDSFADRQACITFTLSDKFAKITTDVSNTSFSFPCFKPPVSRPFDVVVDSVPNSPENAVDVLMTIPAVYNRRKNNCNPPATQSTTRTTTEQGDSSNKTRAFPSTARVPFIQRFGPADIAVAVLVLGVLVGVIVLIASCITCRYFGSTKKGTGLVCLEPGAQLLEQPTTPPHCRVCWERHPPLFHSENDTQSSGSCSSYDDDQGPLIKV